MSPPWLSVVMPTYNGSAYLATALESIRIQADDNLEIIAVDDGSTDSTVELLHDHADRLPLTVIERPHSGNWVAGSDHGLARARGEWVCFLHQDDVWLPDRLATLAAHVRQLPAVDLWLHPAWYIDACGRRLGRWRCPLPRRPAALEPGFVVERLLVQNFIAMPAPLFRRSLALAVGGMAEDLWYAADWDFWLELAAAGRTGYIPRPLAGFRLHAHSQTVQRSDGVAGFRRQLDGVLQTHLRRWEADHPHRPEVRAVAEFAVELNTCLAARLHGQPLAAPQLGCRFWKLGPRGWQRFLRDSRIAERVSARLRAGLRTPSPVRVIPAPA